MARTRRIKAERDLNYHVMSRIAGREFKINEPEAKSALVHIIKTAAAFSGVRICAWCVLDNHFHVVCRIFGSQRGRTPEDVVLERIALLKGRVEADRIRSRLVEFRRQGMDSQAEMLLSRWRRRMEDVSEFVKTLKETFDVWYKRRHPYSGSIWEGRFRSACVQGGAYFRRCVAYVECNPIRAGLATRRGEYAWSSSPTDHPAAVSDLGPVCASWGLSPVEEGVSSDDVRFAARRRAQVTDGKLLGDWRFVLSEIGAFARCFHGCAVRPRPVLGTDGYSSHGHRLARLDVLSGTAA